MFLADTDFFGKLVPFVYLLRNRSRSESDYKMPHFGIRTFVTSILKFSLVKFSFLFKQKKGNIWSFVFLSFLGILSNFNWTENFCLSFIWLKIFDNWRQIYNFPNKHCFWSQNCFFRTNCFYFKQTPFLTRYICLSINSCSIHSGVRMITDIESFT